MVDLTESIQQPSWIDEKIWKQCIGLGKTLRCFKDLTYFINENKEGVWQKIFESDDPLSVEVPVDLRSLSDF